MKRCDLNIVVKTFITFKTILTNQAKNETIEGIRHSDGHGSKCVFSLARHALHVHSSVSIIMRLYFLYAHPWICSQRKNFSMEDANLCSYLSIRRWVSALGMTLNEHFLAALPFLFLQCSGEKWS